MKLNVILSIACFLFTALLHAQAVDKKPVEHPYQDYNERPYPATNLPASPKVAEFMALFEDAEVGNLHVYSDFKDKAGAGYYFAGKKIGAAHKELFASEFLGLAKANDIYATYSIRGNEEEHYIIRMPTNKGSNTLWLFTIEGEVVKPLQQLAFAFCQGGDCYQQDSWITGLNGDTSLDILVKFRRTNAKTGAVTEESEKVYLQDEAGNFRLAEKEKVNVKHGKFDMERLKH